MYVKRKKAAIFSEFKNWLTIEMKNVTIYAIVNAINWLDWWFNVFKMVWIYFDQIHSTLTAPQTDAVDLIWAKL